LTQEEFGKRIGASRDSVATYENGRVTPPEPTIRLIVREFHIDYGWLKDGVGKMFASEDDEVLASLDDIMAGENEKAKKLLRAMARFTDAQWAAFDEIISALENGQEA